MGIHGDLWIYPGYYGDLWKARGYYKSPFGFMGENYNQRLAAVDLCTFHQVTKKLDVVQYDIHV